MASNLTADMPGNGALRLIQSLNRLTVERGQEMEHVIGLLRHQQQRVDLQLRTLEGAPLHRAQGKAQFIADLIDLVEEAPRLVRQLGAKAGGDKFI